jgi:hypothetical protein
MTDAPRTDAPATVAPQRHMLPRPKSSPNPNRNAPSVSSLPSPLASPSSSLTLAPTSSTIQEANVVRDREQVSRQQQSRYRRLQRYKESLESFAFAAFNLRGMNDF